MSNKENFILTHIILSLYILFCTYNNCSNLNNTKIFDNNTKTFDNIKQKKQYKTKLKSFNPRFINLQKNKKTIIDSALLSFFPCCGLIKLKEYNYAALFCTFFVCTGGWFLFNLYHYKDVNNIGTNSSYNFVKHMYFSFGLFIIGYIINIIVTIVLAKMKIFDNTKNLEIVIRPSQLDKKQNIGLDFKF